MKQQLLPGSSRNLFLGAALVLGCLLSAAVPAAPPPKHLLVVTTTKGFRHSSIPTAEKVLGELAASSGAFTVEYARVEPNDPQYQGADGKPDPAKVDAAIKTVLGEKLSPEALKHYDGVIFANTTGGKDSGDLPLPDETAFLNWIKAGHAFIGMHSATDTFRGHVPLHPYVGMIGAEFKGHPPGLCDVECLNQDPKHPACRDFGPTFAVKDEIYLMNGFERGKVHGLLSLDKHPRDKTPGDYPVAWCKAYGKGKVFYTSLGHSESVWESPAYQKHILGGIKWALGLQRGSAKPQTN